MTRTEAQDRVARALGRSVTVASDTLQISSEGGFQLTPERLVDLAQALGTQTISKIVVSRDCIIVSGLTFDDDVDGGDAP